MEEKIMKKRIISIIISITMIFTVFSTTVIPSIPIGPREFIFTEGDWLFTIECWRETLRLPHQYVTRIEYLGDGGEVILPASADGVPVTQINSLRFHGNLDSITSITFPSSVIDIYHNVFSDRRNLETVIFESRRISIRDGAFNNCPNLATVIIPDDISYIHFQNAFRDTAWFNAQPDGVLYLGNAALGWKGTMPANTSVELRQNTKVISYDAFIGQTNLVSINIPDSVTRIEPRVFQETGLKSLIIPDSITHIGRSAFARCENLESVIIGKGVEFIGMAAFARCENLVEIILPKENSIILIENNVFVNTAWFKSQPDGMVYLENIALGWKGYMPENTEVVIRDGTTSITTTTHTETTTAPTTSQTTSNSPITATTQPEATTVPQTTTSSVTATVEATTTIPATTLVTPTIRRGAVINGTNITINDALEILKYLAKLDSKIEQGNEAWFAALITESERPTINDALEILKHLAKLPSKLDE
jgi:hypothetical protein